MDRKETITLQGYFLKQNGVTVPRKNLFNPYWIKVSRFDVPCDWLENKRGEYGYGSIKDMANGLKPEESEAIFDAARHDDVVSRPHLYYLCNTSVEEANNSNIRDLAHDIATICRLVYKKDNGILGFTSLNQEGRARFPEEFDDLCKLLEPSRWALLELLREKDAIANDVEYSEMYIDFLESNNTDEAGKDMRDLYILHDFFDNVKEPIKKTKASVREWEHCKKMLHASECNVHEKLERMADKGFMDVGFGWKPNE